MSEQALFDIPGAAEPCDTWAALFEPAEWTAPYDCADGTPKGAVIKGYRCPACGEVEPGVIPLYTRHGLTPDHPTPHTPLLTRCLAMSAGREDRS